MQGFTVLMREPRDLKATPRLKISTRLGATQRYSSLIAHNMESSLFDS